MTLIKSFSYSNIRQRRLLFINMLISSFLAAAVLSNVFYSVEYYFFYTSPVRYILLAVLPTLVAGSLLGRMIYKWFKPHRVFFILTDVFFVLLCLFYICRFFIVKGDVDPTFALIGLFKYAMLVFAALISFFSGMKVNYYLKIATGDFIDEKQGIYSFILICTAGIFSGITITSLQVLRFINDGGIVIALAMLFVALCLLFSSFFIKMDYSPDTMYLHHFTDEEENQASALSHRTDVFFIYLNVSYIVIYVYLAYLSYIKFYADLRWSGSLFAVACILLIMVGYFLGKFVRQFSWYIYSEMLFPVFFLLYIFLLFRFHEKIVGFQSLVFIIPAALVFGFAICQTMRTLIDKFTHESRYNVLFFSILAIPAPLLIALSFIEFTYLLYFVLVYFLALLNVVIPSLHLINKKARNYQKNLCLAFILIFIPVVLFMHMYLKIPLNSSLYNQLVKNFDELKNTNYNALYIKNKADVIINGKVAFRSSSSVVYGMKKAMIAVFLYHQEDEPILILDGNQKFFRNPVISWFKNYEVIDTVPESFVGYERLPLAGNQLYVADEKNIIDALRNDKKYSVIVDSPNAFDMQRNTFKFSADYYKYVKKRLDNNGIFAEIINLNFCSKKIIARIAQNIESLFKNNIVYFFPDVALILASDGDEFTFGPERYDKLLNTFSQKEEFRRLFFGDSQFFSNLLFNGTNSFLLSLDISGTPESLPDILPERGAFDKLYAEQNDLILPMLAADRYDLKSMISSKIVRDAQVLTLLKEAQLAEASERYIDEMEFLFKLRTLSIYRPDLNLYIKNILSYKEEYYYNAAVSFETKKDWDAAAKLYQAVLALDKDNFEANYRLGLLSLTIQDINSSFRYLRYALSLRHDDPKALTQMGVLLFSTGDPKNFIEALNYLNQALEKNERTPQVFFYLGLVYEELNRLLEAKQSYEKAVIVAPNDKTIQLKLENLNERIKKLEHWGANSPRNEFDVEKGESIQLPVDKTSYDMRLNDDSPLPESDMTR